MDPRLLVAGRDNFEHFRQLRARGQLARVRRGLYCRGGGDGDGSVAPAAAAGRLDAVASHTTAAAIWGLPTLGRTDPRVHLTRPRRHQGTLRDYPEVVLHHAGLPVDHVTVHNGVPVTTPARTVLDLARSQSFRAGVVAGDAALRQRRCSREELAAVAADCRGWPGMRRARHAAGFADPRSESPLESISRVAFHQYRLPPPLPQAVVGGLDRVDFLWDEFRVIGEADGLRKYTEPAALHREKLREEGLAQLGFVVFRWTWREAYLRPDALAHRGEQILIRRGYRP